MVIHSILFDLAGTTIDCGCMAPVAVFIEIFRRRGVTAGVHAARGPMGTHKREHIRRMCVDPGIAEAWVSANGRAPTAEDIDAMYAEAEPLQIACLPRHAEPIPGFLAVLGQMRANGLRIGATTGYTAPMVEVLRPLMAERGWVPDALVSSSDVPAGRPAPYMNHVAAMRLGAPDVAQCVVVGDTVVDMQAARNAGMWAVGVSLTGNEVGLTASELSALTERERSGLAERAGASLIHAGAHVVVDSVADLPKALTMLARPDLAAYKRWQPERV